MIRNCFVILCVFASLWLNTSAQSFQKTFGDSLLSEYGNCIQQLSDGSFIIAATQFGNGNYFERLFLIRTDSNGDTLWTRRRKEMFVNYSASAVIQANNGDFVVTGNKGDGNYSVPYFFRTNDSSTIFISKSYLWNGSESINSIAKAAGDGFLLSGFYYDGTNENLLLLRVDALGDTLWTKSYDESQFNLRIFSLQSTTDGGYITAGSAQNTFSQDADAFLVKLDSSGNVEWSKTYGQSSYDYAQMAIQTADGGYAIAAVTYSFGAGLADYYLIKTDSNGNIEWSRTYGGQSDDRSESVGQLPDSGYLFIGESASFSQGTFDIYMVRTDLNGDTLWTKVLNGPDNNQGYSLVLTNDGGFAIAGQWLNQQVSNDVLFLKADASLSFGCGESSAATIVDNPSTLANWHFLNFVAPQISVTSHGLENVIGTKTNTICITDGVESPAYIKQSLLYPNPVTDKLFVELNDKSESIIGIKVCNLYGAVIEVPFERKLNCAVINCTKLVSGVYILEVQSRDGICYQKIVKE